MDPLYLGEDHNIKWDGAIDEEAASYLNTATVTFELQDTAGTAITGGGGTCSYVAASDGDYLGVLESSASVTLGTRYVCVVTLVQGNYNAKRYIRLVCKQRGKD